MDQRPTLTDAERVTLSRELWELLDAPLTPEEARELADTQARWAAMVTRANS